MQNFRITYTFPTFLFFYSSFGSFGGLESGLYIGCTGKHPSILLNFNVM